MAWQKVELGPMRAEREEPYKPEAHRFHTPKAIPWLTYCAACGHVPLRTGISQLVSRLGCRFRSHATYKRWVESGRKPLPVEA